MKCAVQIYMVLGGFHVYKSVFLGWVVGRFNIAVNGEHKCGVPPDCFHPGIFPSGVYVNKQRSIV